MKTKDFSPNESFANLHLNGLVFQFDPYVDGDGDNATHTIEFVLGCYPNGRLAIELFDKTSGESLATLTTNMVNDSLKDGEVFVKTWSENEEIAKAALESGFFKDTGRRVSAGYVEAQVWMIRNDAMAAVLGVSRAPVR